MKLIIDVEARLYAAFGFFYKADARGNREREDTIIKNAQLFANSTTRFADIHLQNTNSKVSVRFSTDADSSMGGVIAPPPTVTFSREKNINRTAIDGSNFEVIENFGLQSWKIDFSGILINTKEHWYAKNMLSTIKKLVDVNDTFKVVGDIFYDLGIHQIYIEKLDDLSFVEGYNDTVKYKFTARSIMPAEFTI